MSNKRVRTALVIIEILIGLSAFSGSFALVIGAFDQWLPVKFLQGTPFSNYTIPGLLLAIIIGGGMWLGAAMQYSKHAWAELFSAAMGLLLIFWETIEILIINRFEQATIASTIIQQVLLSLLGLTIFELSVYLWTTEYACLPVAIEP